jgi:hypothetical protein
MSALRRTNRRFLSRRERGNRIKTFVGNGPEAVCARPRGSRTEANRLNLVRKVVVATGKSDIVTPIENVSIVARPKAGALAHITEDRRA